MATRSDDTGIFQIKNTSDFDDLIKTINTGKSFPYHTIAFGIAGNTSMKTLLTSDQVQELVAALEKNPNAKRSLKSIDLTNAKIRTLEAIIPLRKLTPKNGFALTSIEWQGAELSSPEKESFMTELHRLNNALIPEAATIKPAVTQPERGKFERKIIREEEAIPHMEFQSVSQFREFLKQLEDPNNTLTELNMGKFKIDNKFPNENDILALIQALKKNNRIQKLDLRGTPLTSEALESIAKLFPNNISLQEVLYDQDNPKESLEIQKKIKTQKDVVDKLYLLYGFQNPPEQFEQKDIENVLTSMKSVIGNLVAIRRKIERGEEVVFKSYLNKKFYHENDIKNLMKAKNDQESQLRLLDTIIRKHRNQNEAFDAANKEMRKLENHRTNREKFISDLANSVENNRRLAKEQPNEVQQKIADRVSAQEIERKAREEAETAEASVEEEALDEDEKTIAARKMSDKEREQMRAMYGQTRVDRASDWTSGLTSEEGIKPTSEEGIEPTSPELQQKSQDREFSARQQARISAMQAELKSSLEERARKKESATENIPPMQPAISQRTEPQVPVFVEYNYTALRLDPQVASFLKRKFQKESLDAIPENNDLEREFSNANLAEFKKYLSGLQVSENNLKNSFRNAQETLDNPNSSEAEKSTARNIERIVNEQLEQLQFARLINNAYQDMVALKALSQHPAAQHSSVTEPKISTATDLKPSHSIITPQFAEEVKRVAEDLKFKEEIQAKMASSPYHALYKQLTEYRDNRIKDRAALMRSKRILDQAGRPDIYTDYGINLDQKIKNVNNLLSHLERNSNKNYDDIIKQLDKYIKKDIEVHRAKEASFFQYFHTGEQRNILNHFKEEYKNKREELKKGKKPEDREPPPHLGHRS